MSDQLCSPNSQETTDIEKLRALCLRWNRAVAAAGYCGSEYIDDPEFVFAKVSQRTKSLRDSLI